MPADTSESHSPGASPTESSADPGQMPPTDAFKAAVSRIAEVLEYARHYVAAQADLVRLRLRRVIVLAALGLVGLLALTTLIATLVVMLCQGLSGLIAQWLGGRAWAGNLIVSGGSIAILGVVAWLTLRHMSRKRQTDTVDRYEQRRRQQQARFGKDAAERAHEKHENS